MTSTSLKDKRVLVIGGSAGIGFDVARIAQDLGASVFIASRGKTPVNAELPGATYLATDAKSEASLVELFNAVGKVDHVAITVHESAARLGIDTTADKMSLDAVIEYFNGKYLSQYRIIKAALPHLAEDGTLTLTSGVASRGTMANHSAISSINAAIEACARQLASELAPRRINVVAPGVTATTTYDAMQPELKSQFVQRIAAVVPLKRIAGPEEIALAYIFAMQCGYLTGTVLDASGGQLIA
ncbi:SDR family oxidoreductase [Robbsia andropogonis]|uniref:SDR family oxidoreductase n=1 Tax=Robbsia andropogonis TaxID=28092 RepID=UPI000466BD7C|nr:SDR family oxidoreductase [Robbsia andropogonis]MCP1117904.1 SDR family oxidoreductase [Robbsia andropogonis]MCP1127368.1 SDR family oxidoreductase [Robbsia andropogonis]